MATVPFDVRIAGTAETPESVSVEDLAEFLRTTAKAIHETYRAKYDGEGKGVIRQVDDEKLATISLVGVEQGDSVHYKLAMESFLLEATREVTHAIAAGQFDTLPIAAWDSLAALSKMASRRGFEIEFQTGNGRAVISAEHEVPPPGARTAVGTTTIYGKCVRIGGVAPKIDIRLIDGSLLHVSATEEMARKLAHRLYEDIGIFGEAKWDAESWAVLDFKAERIIDYTPGSPTEAFKALAGASQGRWKDVDADEYVRTLRARDNQ